MDVGLILPERVECFLKQAGDGTQGLYDCGSNRIPVVRQDRAVSFQYFTISVNLRLKGPSSGRPGDGAPSLSSH